jgi:hypothetical protein
MKVVVIIFHYFDQTGLKTSEYGSFDTDSAVHRKEMVLRALLSIQGSLSSVCSHSEILIAGDPKNALIPIDIDLSPFIENSKEIPWRAIDYAADLKQDYDFIMFIEDDIEINSHTLKLLLWYEQRLFGRSILIPNRLENYKESVFCVDLLAMPGWKSRVRYSRRFRLRQPINIHSGIIFVKATKFRRLYRKREFDKPTILIGDFMASALANLIGKTRVYRAVPSRSKMSVLHLDSWALRQLSLGHLQKNTIEDFIEFNRKELWG